MAKKELIVDLAHASPAVIDDVLATASRPPLFSHTGVQGTCPTPRNIDDEHVKKTAALGGLVRGYTPLSISVMTLTSWHRLVLASGRTPHVEMAPRKWWQPFVMWPIWWALHTWHWAVTGTAPSRVCSTWFASVFSLTDSTVSFGADEVSQVTEGLLLEETDAGEARFTDEEIAAIMGGNVVSFLQIWLPQHKS